MNDRAEAVLTPPADAAPAADEASARAAWDRALQVGPEEWEELRRLLAHQAIASAMDAVHACVNNATDVDDMIPVHRAAEAFGRVL